MFYLTLSRLKPNIFPLYLLNNFIVIMIIVIFIIITPTLGFL